MKQEMKRLKINILGISERRWPEYNVFWSDEFRVINSSSVKGQGGIAIILDQTMAHTVDKIWFEGDRLMMVRLEGKPVDVVIVQVTMTDYKDEEVDAVYERIQEMLDKETKGKDYTLVIRDWNAVVGEVKEDMFVGHNGL